MPSIFTRIINGEIPCYKIAEDNHCIAFLDVNPLTLGHTLIVPKKEVDYIFDISDNEYIYLWNFAKYVACGVKAAVPCKKVGIAVIGLEVPHAHIHLIPLNRVSDMNFANPKMKVADQEMIQIAQQIRSFLSKD